MSETTRAIWLKKFAVSAHDGRAGCLIAQLVWWRLYVTWAWPRGRLTPVYRIKLKRKLREG